MGNNDTTHKTGMVLQVEATDIHLLWLFFISFAFG